jgi:hypothetical protein
MGLVLPKPYRRLSNHRPNRIDLIVETLLAIRRKPDCDASKQNRDLLVLCFHPDLAERKAAANRLGFLWDEAKNSIISREIDAWH